MAICSTMDHDGVEILDGDRSMSYGNMVDYLYLIISHPTLSNFFTILSNFKAKFGNIIGTGQLFNT
jgi:hypothetical protein